MDSIYAAQNKFKNDFGLSKVRVVRNPNYKRNGLKSYVYLMNRFGFDSTKGGPYLYTHRLKQRGLAHPEFKAPLGGRVHRERILAKRAVAGDDTQTGEVTAEDQQGDTEYLCEVSIGTPAQTLLLDFDTGSADLWVFSSSLSKSLQNGHNIYNSSESSTSKDLTGKTWQIQYGDGSSASGTCVSDVLNVGGLSIQNQTVELATKLSTQFAQGTGDGLLGLAFGTINTVMDANGQSDPAATPVENMITQGDIPTDAQLFTSAFYSQRDENPDSFYTFGYIDQDLVTQSGADISWVNIDNSQGFWSFPSESVSINGQQMTSSGNTAIADTGTTLALMSDEVVDALYKQIPGATYDSTQQGYIFPTSVTADDLPDFSVAVGDTQFVIQKEALAFALADDGHWYGGVQSRGTMTFDILGDVFLRNIYAIWDQGNTRFGAVPKLEATQNLTPPTSNGASNGAYYGSERKATSIALARL
ncbi:eukaryotic aspartyl protease [Xylariaceae sp. FL1651]|nr:eukaryotic aspartyl protease [Xylariaceae sp. FL1651]